VGTSGLTAAKLHSDIKKTIDGGHAVVAATNTAYLPNWSRSLSHAITVVGYDDTKNTYKYTDTCGVHCNGSSNAKNGGVWTIAQSALFNAIKTNGGGYVK
jgi:C1A family cysteine protease